MLAVAEVLQEVDQQQLVAQVVVVIVIIQSQAHPLIMEYLKLAVAAVEVVVELMVVLV